MAQVGCCSDLLHKIFCKVNFKTLTFFPEDETTAFSFYAFLFLIFLNQIRQYILLTLFRFFLRWLNWIKLFQYNPPFYFLFLPWGCDWFIFSWKKGFPITVPLLVEGVVHPKYSEQPRGEAPPLAHFPPAIPSITAHLQATFLQEVFVKTL